MSFCKPVREIENIKTDWIPGKIREIFADYTLEEFVLCVRNGSINMFMYDDSFSEIEKGELIFLTDEVRDTLVANGFIRPEMIMTNTPELYFLLNYLIELGLISDYIIEKEMDNDYDEVFMPYYYSNEQYEEYTFCYERIEAVINVLSNFLDADELYEVALDIMYMSDHPCDNETLENAKQKLVDRGLELVPLLEQAFAMY